MDSNVTPRELYSTLYDIDSQIRFGGPQYAVQYLVAGIMDFNYRPTPPRVRELWVQIVELHFDQLMAT